MQQPYSKYLRFNHHILIIGFGSIGQAVLPLIFRHLDIKPEQVTIITKKTDGEIIADEYQVQLYELTVTQQNYRDLIDEKLRAGDFLLNLSVDVSSIDLIKYCQQKNILYLDTCIEPWEGGYFNSSVSSALRSNYALREFALAVKAKGNPTTAVITHGANPGLVSYFVKQALLNLAKDANLFHGIPQTQSDWAKLSCSLGVKAIHIAERDTQVASQPKRPGEFVNTWSIDGFIGEGSQPAELGWGSHERHWPFDAHQHDFGTRCAIYLTRPGGATRVRTWTPMAGCFHGFLITHNESISIADYFTIKGDHTVAYRPTVHYAYHPCEDAVLSLHELAGREWRHQESKRLLLSEIIDGIDELGVLIMGPEKGAYWYGSQLSIHDARRLVPHNNATSLQVAISVLAGMIWAMEHPHAGIVEPDEIDFKYILNITMPYLGTVAGRYTNWTPLEDRERLFPEMMDRSDPWQFINMRVI